jgi:hypothetical protein
VKIVQKMTTQAQAAPATAVPAELPKQVCYLIVVWKIGCYIIERKCQDFHHKESFGMSGRAKEERGNSLCLQKYQMHFSIIVKYCDSSLERN